MWIVIELVLMLNCYLLLLKIQEQCWELVSCRSKDSHLFVFFVSKRNPICSTKGNLLKIKKLPIPSSRIPIKLWFQSETTQSILFIIRPAHLSKILKTSSKLPQKIFFLQAEEKHLHHNCDPNLWSNTNFHFQTVAIFFRNCFCRNPDEKRLKRLEGGFCGWTD